MERYNSENLGMNTPKEKLLENIEINCKRGLQALGPHNVQDQRICIVGGGLSLKETLGELKELVEEGAKVVAVNGAHDWLIDNGILPSAMVMVDAQPHNIRFAQKPIKKCKYLIASQCDPIVFDALKDHNLFIWHAVIDQKEDEQQIIDKYYKGKYSMVVGGSTVALRAIWLMRVLGYHKIDLFGIDSCVIDEEHHIYPQKENDEHEIQDVICSGKEFRASAWMISQADDFIRFIKCLGSYFELNVHGNGLISHIIRTGAEALQEQNNGSRRVVNLQ